MLTDDVVAKLVERADLLAGQSAERIAEGLKLAFCEGELAGALFLAQAPKPAPVKLTLVRECPDATVQP